MNTRLTRMVFATAALAAFATMLAGPAAASDVQQLSGRAASRLTDGRAAVVQRHLPPSKRTSRWRNGDSPIGRVVAPEPLGLTGDSASTRVPNAASATAAVSRGRDVDWASFGAGAGTVALLVAGLAAILLASRRRHTVGMP